MIDIQVDVPWLLIGIFIGALGLLIIAGLGVAAERR